MFNKCSKNIHTSDVVGVLGHAASTSFRAFFSLFIILFSLSGYLANADQEQSSYPSGNSYNNYTTIDISHTLQSHNSKPVAHEKQSTPCFKAILERSSFENIFSRSNKSSPPCLNADLGLLQSHIHQSPHRSENNYFIENCLSYEFLRLNVLSAKHHPPTFFN